MVAGTKAINSIISHRRTQTHTDIYPADIAE